MARAELVTCPGRGRGHPLIAGALLPKDQRTGARPAKIPSKASARFSAKTPRRIAAAKLMNAGASNGEARLSWLFGAAALDRSAEPAYAGDRAGLAVDTGRSRTVGLPGRPGNRLHASGALQRERHTVR